MQHRQERHMINQMQDFVAEQTSALTGQIQKFGKDSVETVREAVVGSADTLKALKSPVRVSQTAVASLIELQSDMLTSALSDAALRLERASRADNVVDLVRDQIELIPATRDRIVEDAQRAVQIFKHAGRDVRGVVKHVYERVVEPVEDKIPEVKVKVQKRKPAAAKRAAAKTRARKTAAAAA
jgi:hypothetical protein